MNSRPQMPRSLWSAPRIATSEKVQHRKSAIQGLPVALRMLRVKFNRTNQKIEPFQRSWYVMLTKRSAASGDENGLNGE